MRAQQHRKPRRLLAKWAVRVVLAVLLLLLDMAPALAETWLAYQAMPAAGTDLPSVDARPYAVRQALAEAAARQIVPDAVDAVGLRRDRVSTEMVAGGYELRTDPSLLSRIEGAGRRDVDRLAAALGLILRQSSVLVLDLDDAAGGQFYVRVAFPQGTLTPVTADAFYRHAAAVEKGLGGGFTAFGDTMLFVNLRDARGRPYGGLGDADFLTALHLASTTFADPPIRIGASGYAGAWFVDNDWRKAPDGAFYRQTMGQLPAAARAAIRALADRFAAEARAVAR